jgi:hypothetical protein
VVPVKTFRPVFSRMTKSLQTRILTGFAAIFIFLRESKKFRLLFILNGSG